MFIKRHDPSGEVSVSAVLLRHVLNGETMGTRYSAIFFGAADLDLNTIGKALQHAVDLVDNQMSNWKADSDLTRFNRSAVGNWVAMPDEILAVISEAIRIGRLSRSAFDIGVAEIVGAWGFGPDGSKPDESRIADLGAAHRPSTITSLDIDRNRSRLLKRADVKLDLCGIAKGYGVDRLAACLTAFGIDRYLVSIDGEVRAGGCKAGGTPWTIGVEKPDRQSRDIAFAVPVTNMAVATSGDYRHWVERAGATYSHTIDPILGQPVRNRLVSVTVAASDCVRADAWATALLVLGEVEGPLLADKLGIDAFFMSRERGEIAGHAVGGIWGRPIL